MSVELRKLCGSVDVRAAPIKKEEGSVESLWKEILSTSAIARNQEAVLSSRLGGEADKSGNRYEGAWTVRHLLYVLAGKAESVTVEDFGDLTQEVEFTY
ncbi:hypothetical protein [Streptomyces sp. NPDC005953]|uniref:hypothetical protein n=1 Tax=Streptomyces sp. NPDC005953 TaxID=3156719 RepID=UPI0033D2B666